MKKCHHHCTIKTQIRHETARQDTHFIRYKTVLWSSQTLFEEKETPQENSKHEPQKKDKIGGVEKEALPRQDDVR